MKSVLKESNTNYREVLKLINLCKSPLLVKIEVLEIYKKFRSSFDKFKEDLDKVKKEEVMPAPFDTELFYVKRGSSDVNIVVNYDEQNLQTFNNDDQEFIPSDSQNDLKFDIKLDK